VATGIADSHQMRSTLPRILCSATARRVEEGRSRAHGAKATQDDDRKYQFPVLTNF
jgi:hypothetical protein